jgi:HEAT repeats
MSSAQKYRALEVLSELVRDKTWFVRLRAVVALGQLHNALATPSILQALADPNRLVRMRAGEALVTQPEKMAGIFAQVVAMRDRYGLHAYLAALENANLRPKLEAELARDRSLKRSEKSDLLQVLASGKLMEQQPEQPAAAETERVVG